MDRTSGSASGLEEAFEQVMQAARQKAADLVADQPHLQLWDAMQGFVHAIDWRERFIMGLLGTQTSLLIFTLATRRHTTLQTCIFGLAVGILFFGERLNALGSRHWETFATQNYFDKRGVFFGVLIAGPLLLNMFIILVNYLLLCTSLMVQAKKLQLKQKARQRQQQSAAEAEQSTPTSGSKKSN